MRASHALVWALAVACLGLCLALPSPGAAQAAPELYDREVDAALAAYDASHFDEACAHFRAAHRAWPGPRTLRGIGMCSYELHDYAEAYRALRAALDGPPSDRPLTDAQRAHAAELLTRVEPLVAVYTDVPPRASLVIDGAAVEASETVVLPLGAHELTVSRDGRTVAAHLQVRGGERGPLPFDRRALLTEASSTTSTGSGTTSAGSGTTSTGSGTTSAGSGATSTTSSGTTTISPGAATASGTTSTTSTGTSSAGETTSVRVVELTPTAPTLRPLPPPPEPRSFQLGGHAFGSLGAWDGGAGAVGAWGAGLDVDLAFVVSAELLVGPTITVQGAWLLDGQARSATWWWLGHDVGLAVIWHLPGTPFALRGALAFSVAWREQLTANGARSGGALPSAGASVSVGARVDLVPRTLYVAFDLRGVMTELGAFVSTLGLGVETPP